MDASELTSLGARLRAEWRDEHDAAARDAFEAWQHRRTLVELLASARAAGDVVSAAVGASVLRGHLVDVGPDCLVLRGAPGHVVVALSDRVVVAVEDGARAPDPEPARPGLSLRARLLELEMAGAPVHVEAAGTSLRGRLTVGADMVVVRHGEISQVVRTAAIDWVRADDESDLR